MKKTKETGPIGGYNYEDPAYVTAKFSRMTGNATLFGSSVKHHQMIALEISHADMNRSLSRDWIHGGKPIIEVWFSPNQFAELITTMNMGSGIPGTMRYHSGEMFDLPEIPSKAEQFKEEAKESLTGLLSEIKEEIDKVEILIDEKKPLGQGAKKDLASILRRIEGFVTNNLGFIMSQFAEQMEKTVVEAKAEVEAFVDHAITQTGLEALKDSQPKLLDYDKDEES